METKINKLWIAIRYYIDSPCSRIETLKDEMVHDLKVISLPRKTVIQTVGKPSDWFYFFLSGVAVAYAPVDTGDVHTRIAVHAYGSGDFLLPNIEDSEHDVSMVDLELACDSEFLILPHARYKYFLHTYPSFNIFDQQYRSVTRMRWITQTASLKAMRNVTDRMLWYLNQSTECFHALSDQALGDILGGFTREVICRNRHKVIGIHYNRIKERKM